MARRNRQVETRMVSEYLLQHYASFPRLTMVPLGAVDDQLQVQYGYAKAIRMSRPFRPEVDAVVILPRHLLLVEAKVWKVVDGLAKLPLYKSLVATTPEFREYKDLEVIMELVVGWTNVNLETMARAAGVAVKVYSPPWLADEVSRMQSYWTAEYQSERQKKLEMQDYFGVR